MSILSWPLLLTSPLPRDLYELRTLSEQVDLLDGSGRLMVSQPVNL
jgi:hypothetical protein